MHPLRLLVLSGSQRQGSYNLQLATVAAGLARQRGAEVVMLDLRALALPVYDGDLEASEGPPAGALRLRDALAHSQALLVVTPEYNGFPPPLLINALDWLSRVPAAAPQPSGLAATQGKPMALMSASPGPLGALRSMNFLRQYLQMAFAMLVLPQQHALGRAAEAFDPAGELRDDKARSAAAGVVDALLALGGKLNPVQGAV